MKLRRFLLLLTAVCSVFVAGLFVVLNGERSAVERHRIDVDTALSGGREGKSLTIITRDNVKIYEKHYEKTAELPGDLPEDMLFMVRFAGENLFNCEKPSTEEDFNTLKFHNIPSEGLKNCIVLQTAQKALGSKSVHVVSRIVLWRTAADIVAAFGVDGVLKSYMQNSYMQNDIWGVEAASQSYFGKSVVFADAVQKTWLASVLTLGILPDDDHAAFYKRMRMLLYRLYVKGYINHEEYFAGSADTPEYNIEKETDSMPEYTALIIDELKSKGIRTDRELVVYANISTKTIKAANEAIAEKTAEYPRGIKTALAVVNYETGGVEALAANDRWQFRTMQMRRQIGSTFKPIVYLTAVSEGAMPNEIITDKRYRYNLGNYVYSPANFEDYYMGAIPLRLGLVHSLNNATIRLAKLVGLRKVGNMAVNLGMKAKIKPYLAMPLGIFPITPLNLAKVYSVFGNYGIKKEIGFISRIENGHGETIYLKKENPVRVAPERETYQVVYMMKDVVRRGTARGSGILWGSAAKTGTTDEYRDAWTVALFPPYAVVCWVGFDDHRSMGEKGTGGGRAAPVIASFQHKLLDDEEKIDFQVPKGVVFKYVDAYTGRVVGRGCSSRKSYMEAFLEESVPDDCNRSKLAGGLLSKNNGS